MLIILSKVSGVCLWVNNFLGERDCSPYLSQERWSYCAAVTFCLARHGILQLLPLSCGTTTDDCSWMQWWNPCARALSSEILHLFVMSEEEKQEKVFRQHPAEIWRWLALTCLQKVLREITTKPQTTRWKSPHQTTLSVNLKKLKLCVYKSSI